MGDFNRDRGRPNRHREENNSWGRSSSFSPRRTEMHSAVCANCGKNCEVPFKPTGDKPVFCRDCFNQTSDRGDRGGRDDRSERNNYNDRGNRGSFDRQMFSAVCDSCGKNCEVPFKPTGDKPVFCSDCFSKNDSGRSKPRMDFKSEQPKAAVDNELKNQLSGINEKLDRLLRALEIRGKIEPTVEKSMTVVKPVTVAKSAKVETKAIKVVKKPAIKEEKKAVAKVKAKSTTKAKAKTKK